MKIRAGFVSNSSTSSFCVLGVNLTLDKVQEKLRTILDSDMDVYCYSMDFGEDTYMYLNDEDPVVDQYKRAVGLTPGKTDTLLVGCAVNHLQITNVMEHAEKLSKLLDVPLEELKVSGWGYYNG